MKSNSPWLLGAGLAVVGLFGAIIGWGRVRDVRVPVAGVWHETPIICAHGVSPVALNEAVGWWRGHGWDLVVGCGHANISLDADPTVDGRASYDDVEVTHGLTVAHVVDGAVTGAEIRVLPGSSSLVVAHELGHALGLLHPTAAPTGHMMRGSNNGWDGRGCDAPRATP